MVVKPREEIRWRRKAEQNRVKRGKELTWRNVHILLRETLDKDRKQQGGEIIRRIMRGKYIREQKRRVGARNSRCRRRRQTLSRGITSALQATGCKIQKRSIIAIFLFCTDWRLKKSNRVLLTDGYLMRVRKKSMRVMIICDGIRIADGRTAGWKVSNAVPS